MAGINTPTPNFSGNSPKMIVPVTTEATYSTGPMMIGFIIIILLVGVALFLYTRNHHNERDRGGGEMDILISNKSQLPFNVTLPDSRMLLSPNTTMKVNISQYDIIKATAHTYDGQELSYEFKVSNPKIKKIYLSPSGFSSNLSGTEDVEFVNNSPYPILFIERSDSGSRRWGTDIVPPRSSSGGHFVARNTIWEVSHPTDENNPIDHLTVSGKVKQIIYDGNSLKAI